MGRDRHNKLFTGPDPVHNIPVGIAWGKGRYTAFAEYGFGRKTAAISFGLAIAIN